MQNASLNMYMGSNNPYSRFKIAFFPLALWAFYCFPLFMRWILFLMFGLRRLSRIADYEMDSTWDISKNTSVLLPETVFKSSLQSPQY